MLISARPRGCMRPVLPRKEKNKTSHDGSSSHSAMVAQAANPNLKVSANTFFQPPSIATSRRMAKIKGTATGPEIVARKVLSSLGVRYRLLNRDLQGSPDLANRSAGWVIFVHGCFWHRHPGCPRSTSPTRNVAYWQEKFRRTEQRDAEAQLQLLEAGWRVYTIWECCAETAARKVGHLIIRSARESRPAHE